MFQRLFTLLALCGLPALAAAHEGQNKALDNFDRVQVRQFKIEVDSTGLNTNFTIVGHGHYPTGTALKIAVRYVKGETSELHPYGAKEQHEQYAFWKTVFVKDWEWSLKIKTRDMRLPAGEYVLVVWYLYDEQSWAVKQVYRGEYVPEDERKKESDLCADCKRHFQLAKTVLLDPSVKLLPKYREMSGLKLWQRQKAQALDAVLESYRDWLQQVQDARTALDRLRRELLGVGPLEDAQIGRLLEQQKTDEERALVQARETLSLARERLQACQAGLARRTDVPRDPYRYFRLLARGDGMPENEDPANPEPQSEGYVRWRFNYILPRLEVVRREINEYKKNNRILLHRVTYYKVLSALDEVKEMCGLLDKLVDGTIELTGSGGVLAEVEKAGDKPSPEAVQKLVENFHQRFRDPRGELARTEVRFVRYLKAVLKDTLNEVKFPVGSWPLPASIGEQPKLTPEQQKEVYDKEFKDLKSEMGGK